jgi:hypothetical protein
MLVGKPEGKRPLGRPRCTRENNTKINLKDILLGGMDWIDPGQHRNNWRAIVE